MGGFKENIGKNIARLRKLHCLSQEQLAHEAGIARDKISKMEGGALNITMETLEKLCTFFGVTPNELLLPHEEAAEPGTDGAKHLTQAERMLLARLKLKELDWILNDETEE